MPIGKPGTSKGRVSPRRFRQRRWNLRHAIHNKTFWRGDSGFLCAHRRKHEESQCEQVNESFHLESPPNRKRRVHCIHHQRRVREKFFQWLQTLLADRVTLNSPKLLLGASHASSNGIPSNL